MTKKKRLVVKPESISLFIKKYLGVVEQNQNNHGHSFHNEQHILSFDGRICDKDALKDIDEVEILARERTHNTNLNVDVTRIYRVEVIDSISVKLVEISSKIAKSEK